MKKILKVLGVGMLVLMSGCGSDTLSSWFISKEQEYDMGVEFNKQLRDSLSTKTKIKIYEASTCKSGEPYCEWVKYIDSIKVQMAAKIPQSDWDGLLPSTPSGVTSKNFFKVALIDEKTINAFAVPGGYFYIYTGILKDFRSESELVGVMGHEIGHIVKHHARKSMAEAAALGTGASLVLGDQSSTGAQIIASLGMNYFLQQNSQDHELEADQMGVTFSNWLSENPQGISDYFGKELVDPNTGVCTDKDAGFLSSVSQAFSTHPPHCERVTQVNNLIKADTHLQELAKQPKSSSRYLALKALL